MRINVPLLETIFMLSEFFRHGTIAASASNPSNLPMKAKTKTAVASSSVSSPSPTVRGWFFNCPLGRDSLHTNSSKGFNLGLFLDLRGWEWYCGWLEEESADSMNYFPPPGSTYSPQLGEGGPQSVIRFNLTPSFLSFGDAHFRVEGERGAKTMNSRTLSLSLSLSFDPIKFHLVNHLKPRSSNGDAEI